MGGSERGVGGGTEEWEGRREGSGEVLRSGGLGEALRSGELGGGADNWGGAVVSLTWFLCLISQVM